MFKTFRRRRRKKKLSSLRFTPEYKYRKRKRRSNREFNPKPLITFLTVAVIIGAVSFMMPKIYANPFKKVKVVDGYGEYILITKAETVREIYQSGALNMKESDSTVSLDTVVSDNMTLYVDRSIVVNVISGGTNVKIRTSSGTAREILTKAGVSFHEDDAFNVSLDDIIYNGDVIIHEKIETKTVTKRVSIAFDTVEVEDSTLLKGKTDVVFSGENGYKNVSYLITYQDGEEISRVVSGEKVIKEPVSRKIAIGTKEPTVVASSSGGTKPSGSSTSSLSGGSKPSGSSSGGNVSGSLRPSKPVNIIESPKDLDPQRIKSVKVMGVTAYTHTGNATATGVMPSIGTIAVNPNEIPLGTKIYVPGYGIGIAQDTGALAANTIDIFLNSRDECLRWGRKSLTVYILKY